MKPMSTITFLMLSALCLLGSCDDRAPARRASSANTQPSVETSAPGQEAAPEKTNAEGVAVNAAPQMEGSASLQVNCVPWCKIRVDGADFTASPYHQTNLSAGKHTVIVWHPDHGDDVIRTVTLDDKVRTSLRYDFVKKAWEADKNKPALQNKPQDKVAESESTTPAEGEATLEVVKAKTAGVEKTEEKPATEETPSSTTKPKPPEKPIVTVDPGTLRVTCQPWCTVLVDGKAVGKTPYEKPIPEGEHTVVLKYPVKETEKTKTVMIKSQQTTTLHYDFDKDAWK